MEANKFLVVFWINLEANFNSLITFLKKIYLCIFIGAL